MGTVVAVAVDAAVGEVAAFIAEPAEAVESVESGIGSIGSQMIPVLLQRRSSEAQQRSVPMARKAPGPALRLRQLH